MKNNNYRRESEKAMKKKNSVYSCFVGVIKFVPPMDGVPCRAKKLLDRKCQKVGKGKIIHKEKQE